MPEKKDIADLLEEVQSIVHALRAEKSDLHDQVSHFETQMSAAKEEHKKEMQTLRETNEHLTKELQETKARLSGELQNTQQKLDRFHPEMQSLQDELQNAELQNNLLEIELSKKNEELKALEDRLQAFTSLALAELPAEKPIA